MRVEVEELVALVADEIMTTAGSPARNANRLRHLERCLEGAVIDWRDAIDA